MTKTELRKHLTSATNAARELKNSGLTNGVDWNYQGTVRQGKREWNDATLLRVANELINASNAIHQYVREKGQS
jgi:hypothetical protein